MIGERIRTLRRDRGYSIRQLAVRAGVSIGLISHVERGINDPSLQTLRAISRALDTPLFDLFQPTPATDLAIVRVEDRVAVGSPHGGMTYQRVSAGAGRLEVLDGLLAPHAASSAEPWSHPSEEVALVTAGSVVLEVSGARHHLGLGDSCSFDSRLPHRYLNDSDTPARFIVSITPPGY